MTLLAARFPHLKAYLSSHACASDALNFEQLLGFLYAVSSAPDVIGAEEWLPFVFCDRTSAEARTQEAQRALMEALDLHHAINCQVLAAKVELPQDCLPRADALANLDPESGLSRWSQGFAVGHDWLEEAWESSVLAQIDDDLDWQLGGCMAVLCFFSSRETAEALHAGFRTGARSLEDRARLMLELLPDALKAYADIGRNLAVGSQDDADDESRDDPVAVGSVGSFEDCPCGSGHPRRLCCGTTRTVH